MALIASQETTRIGPQDILGEHLNKYDLRKMKKQNAPALKRSNGCLSEDGVSEEEKHVFYVMGHTVRTHVVA